MAATLVDMAIRACMNNVEGITDVGDMPYSIMRPIIRRIENPEQLREIERVSPQIAGEDAEVWQTLIKRDIPGGAKKLETSKPRNPASWSKVYRKLKREDEEQRIAAEEALKASLNKHKTMKDSHSTQIIHAVIPSEYKKPSWNTGPRDKPSGSQALRNARTMADKMTILKRQTAQRQQGRSLTQSIPSHELQTKRSAIQRAPTSMVNQYTVKKAVQAPLASVPHARSPVFVTRAAGSSERDRLINQQIRKEREEREQRLRALTGASTPATASSAKPAAPQPARTATPTPSVVQRKRPAYNPMMPAKKRKT